MTFRLPTEPRLIGPALRELRIRLNVKQQTIVDAGVGSQSTISALENGVKMPLFSTVIGYLAVLDCALDITRLNGEPMPEPHGFARARPDARQKVYVPRPYKYRPRKKNPAPPEPVDPNAPKVSPGTTAMGRCLGCFTVHQEGNVFCS